nr:CAAX prenyl protease 1 homolog [Setaria viridis]
MALPYLEAVLCFMILVYIFETYLQIRQHRVLKLPTLPKPLLGVISDEKFKRSRDYTLHRSYFRFVHEAVTILMHIAILFFRVLPWFWKKSGELVTDVGLNAENEIIHTLAFLAGAMVLLQPLPVQVRRISVHNANDLDNKVSAYNIARGLLQDIKRTRGTVESEASRLAALANLKVKDVEKMMALYHEAKAAYEAMPEAEKGPSEEQIKMMAALSRLSVAQEVARVIQDAAATMASLNKSLTKNVEELEVEMRRPTFMGCGSLSVDCFILLSMILGPLIVAAIIYIVHVRGLYVAIYLSGFIFVLALLMVTIYPIVIAPLFNKFTPLPGVLREKIEKLAASLKFPLKKLFVVDGSTRSSQGNAYMYGFYKNKRIVLYDALIQQSSNEDEIVSVITHELGHWKLNHALYSFLAFQLLMFLQFGGYTLVRNSKGLFKSFGFSDQPIIIGLIIFQYAIMPLQHLLNFCFNLVSRAFEYQADAFAKNLGYAPQLRAALVKLQEENLFAMNTDPWYSSYHHYSHPPLVERLQALEDPDSEERRLLEIV